jgi:hypothetical protein
MNKFQKMKNIYSAIALFLINSCFGQAPDWTVDENKYQYTMTFGWVLNMIEMD